MAQDLKQKWNWYDFSLSLSASLLPHIVGFDAFDLMTIFCHNQIVDVSILVKAIFVIG